MAIAEKLRKYLEVEHVDYKQMHHPEAFVASEIAGQQHIPGKQFAKAVVVNADGKYLVCALPASRLIDFDKLKKVLDAKDVRLVKEEEIGGLFPDFQRGSEPPFGNLYNLPVYSDATLEVNDEIVVNAGTHTDLIKIKWKDFVRLVKPISADFSKPI